MEEKTHIIKCQLKVSKWCKKIILKSKAKLIKGKYCCEYCYDNQKRSDKEKRKEN